MSVRILVGDCTKRMAELADASVDSVVCDPPYHLTSIVKRFGAEGAAPAKVGATGAYARASKGFMGQTWDGGDVAFRPETWAEVLRVLKPGGHLIAFSGTRTYHRMAVAIEDAGFEIRDQLAWVYGSGFPKSLDVSKAIDKLKDWSLVERLSGEIKRARAKTGMSLKEIGRVALQATNGQYGAWYHRGGHMFFETGRNLPSRPEWEHLRKVLPIADEFLAVYEAAEREVIKERTMTQGGGSSLQIRMGDKREVNADITAPATEAAKQWQGWGTALKPAWEPICLARKPITRTVASNVLEHGTGALNIDGCRIETSELGAVRPVEGRGRNDGWGMSGGSTGSGASSPLGRWPANIIHDGSDEVVAAFPATETGDLNADGRSRNSGFGMGRREGLGHKGSSGSAARFFYCAKTATEERGEGNNHPTVKPIALMQWLVRLVTPKGGTVLDPFMGSGSTGLACQREQMSFIGCEMSPEYAAIAERRLTNAGGLFAQVEVLAA